MTKRDKPGSKTKKRPHADKRDRTRPARRLKTRPRKARPRAAQPTPPSEPPAPPSEPPAPPSDVAAPKPGSPAARVPRLAIAGIGASAGGLAALQQFFEHVDADSGIAYVVVTHQAPGRTTLLPELLARSTRLVVQVAQDGMRLRPNQVYVAPPGCCLEARDGDLRVTHVELRMPVMPIDHFFRSLAKNLGDHGIGIVLSGNGSDGTIGATEIKAASGLVIAQDPQTAQYSGMPGSVIATQLVDYVLPPAEMPAQLVRYVQDRDLAATQAPGLDDHTSANALQQILLILRGRSGNDFRAYKSSTIKRRIARRMHVRGIADPAEYARFLEQAPYEADALFKELLISVTGFFRDPPAFEALEQQLAELVANKLPDAPLRAWIAGCATGEEAYTIGILFREALQRADKPLNVQIFATDLDPQAIEIARAGNYAEGIVADVTPERLQRFFTHEDTGYRINKDVRELIVFAVQNAIKDPPFTGLDLISCRNLLIYLEADLQRRLLAMFGYALRPGGLLLLGTSESVTSSDDRFVALDKRWKLFQRSQAVVTRALPNFPAELPVHGERPAASPPGDGQRERTGLGSAAEKTLLDQFVPPSIVVNEHGDLMYTHGRVGRFLEPAAGEPSHNAFHMARQGLQLELPTAVRLAAASLDPVVRRGVRVKDNGGHAEITLTARRLRSPQAMRGSVLVSFEIEQERVQPVEPKPRARRLRGKQQRPRTAELERELERTRQNLQKTIEQLETSNEELKSTNEELQSTNEELQSANEELETSREEMQSLNEELQTVNAELEERNRALSQANDDMQNLLNSTEVATVFLDNQLAIKRFTVQAKKVFNLIGSDVGRPIADLAANLRYEGLVDDAREVMNTLVFREREVQTKDGSWRQMRIMPYRTHENMIDGIVITFVDIDRLKRIEQVAQASRALAEDVIESMHPGIVLLDEELNVTSANHTFCELFRIERARVVGMALDRLFEGSIGFSDMADRLRAVLAEHTGGEGVRVEAKLPRRDGVQDLVFNIRRIKPEADRLAHLILTIESAPMP